MSRYIDADALIDRMKKDPLFTLVERYGVTGVIEAEPTADVVERKKGRWKIKTINTFDLAYGSTGYEPVYECSVCGSVEESYLRLDEPIMPEDADFPNYCPNCGAEMEEMDD